MARVYGFKPWEMDRLTVEAVDLIAKDLRELSK